MCVPEPTGVVKLSFTFWPRGVKEMAGRFLIWSILPGMQEHHGKVGDPVNGALRRCDIRVDKVMLWEQMNRNPSGLT